MDIDHLRTFIEPLDLLRRLGLADHLRWRGREIHGPCPMPDHPGDRDNKGAFAVYWAGDHWRAYCFSHCGSLGDEFEWVERVYHIGFKEALRLVADWVGQPWNHDGAVLRRTAHEPRPLAMPVTQPEWPMDPGLFGPLPPEAWAFLRTRYPVVRPETWMAWDIVWGLGDWTDNPLTRRIVFPIFDTSGRTVGGVGRTLVPDPKERKFKNAPGSWRRHTIHGLHQRSDTTERILLVEGIPDCVALNQYPLPETVIGGSILGTGLTEEQAMLIAQLGLGVDLALDSDLAGQQAIYRSGTILQRAGVADLRVVSLGTLEVKADAASVGPGPFLTAWRAAQEWEAWVDALPQRLPHAVIEDLFHRYPRIPSSQMTPSVS